MFWAARHVSEQGNIGEEYAAHTARSSSRLSQFPHTAPVTRRAAEAPRISVSRRNLSSVAPDW